MTGSQLKEYGIISKTVRIGFTATPKGYERAHQFEEAFLRYVATPDFIRHTPQTVNCLCYG